jgi:hypothetical protein
VISNGAFWNILVETTFAPRVYDFFLDFGHGSGIPSSSTRIAITEFFSPWEVSMGRIVAGLLVLLIAASSTPANQHKTKPNHTVDHKADIAALREQIKELQAEKKATLEAIKAQYQSILHGDKLSKTQLEDEKKALKNEEKALLELATSTDEKHTIREQFQLLLQVLTGEIHLDKELIDKIKKQEKGQVALIRAIYDAKIKELRNLITALEHKGKGN